MDEAALRQAIAARQKISKLARGLLAAHGYDVSERELMTHGAYSLLTRAGVSPRALKVHPDWLLATGHASLGQLDDYWDGDDYWDNDWDSGNGQDYLPEEPDPFPDDEELTEKEKVQAAEAEAWAEAEAEAEAEAKAEGLPEDFVAPAPVPMRPDNWDLDSKPARYKLAWGDTLVGLAGTYLHDGSRWREIWDMQPASYHQTRTPDKIFVGDWLNMPAEAVKTLLGEHPEKKAAPDYKTFAFIAGALVVGLGAGYVFTRKS